MSVCTVRPLWIARWMTPPQITIRLTSELTHPRMTSMTIWRTKRLENLKNPKSALLWSCNLQGKRKVWLMLMADRLSGRSRDLASSIRKNAFKMHRSSELTLRTSQPYAHTFPIWSSLGPRSINCIPPSTQQAGVIGEVSTKLDVGHSCRKKVTIWMSCLAKTSISSLTTQSGT